MSGPVSSSLQSNSADVAVEEMGWRVLVEGCREERTEGLDCIDWCIVAEVVVVDGFVAVVVIVGVAAVAADGVVVDGFVVVVVVVGNVAAGVVEIGYIEVAVVQMDSQG